MSQTLVTGIFDDDLPGFVPAGFEGGHGRIIATQIFTSSGTYTPTVGTTRVRVRMVGGGGGGGGGVGGANAAIGGGGASGFYLEFRVGDGTTAVTGGTVTRGAAGAGGSTSGGDGGAGGGTSIVINGTTFTAPGGSGGEGQPSSVVTGNTSGGSDAAIAPAGVDIVVQQAGEPGLLISGTGFSGRGGGTPLGGGGFALQGVADNGNTGSGYGGGGSGAVATAAGKAGGAGAAGVVIVEEFS